MMIRLSRDALLLLAAALGASGPVVAQQRIAEVQVAPPYLRMRTEAQVRLVATAYDAEGVPVDAPVRWVSSNINVAEVSQDGMVRALAPGVTVVSAIFESGARRRGGQTTVFVLSEPRPGPRPVPRPGVTPGVSPPAASPPTPAAPPAPGAVMPPRPAPRHLDSAMRASVDCTEPFLNATNPLRACWERPPVPRARMYVEVPEECRLGVHPARLLIQVNQSGAVEEARLFIPSTCPAYDEAALAQARRMTFEPATRGGQPVRAWVHAVLGPDLKRERRP